MQGNINTNSAISAVGVITANAGISDSAGTRMDAGGGWLRSYGATGWYNGTYGGGWNMTDATWIRAFGSKSVYSAGQIRGDGGLCIGADCRTSWPGGAALLGAEITQTLTW